MSAVTVANQGILHRFMNTIRASSHIFGGGMFRILIFGAGSIGIFLGTKLYTAGHEVLLYGRRKLQSLTDIILINDKAYKLPPRIYQLPAESNYDYIFVTTKLYDTQKAVEDIKYSPSRKAKRNCLIRIE